MTASHPGRLVTLVVVLGLALAACGGGGESGESASAAASSSAGGGAAAELDVINEGQLAVCTDSPYRPFEFEEDGQFTGFDVDLVNAIADGLGLEAQYQVTPFDAIQSGAALNARQCDLAASAMTITEDRAENLAFSDAYFDADQSLMIRSDDAGTYGSLDDLSGQPIGVQASTTGAKYANENAPANAEVVDYPDASALFQALQGNEIAAVLQDFPVNAFFANQNDTVEVVEQYPTGEQYGFAAQKDNTTLIEAVNEQLATLQSDGTYEQIYKEWFGTAPSSASEGASAAPAASESPTG